MNAEAMTTETVELARELIRRPSVTPEDAGCQQLMSAYLAPLGFAVEPLRYGDVDNLWAVRNPDARPLFVFAGHTDVVPTGPEARWSHPPFAAEIHDGVLYGRGAADMKSSLAAMLTATRDFVRDHPGHRGAIGFLITSDEEGPARDGTVRVIDALQQRGTTIDACLVGEPTSSERTCDTIKNGRRGSIGGRLRVMGKQGHVAYPQLALNPIHAALAALDQLARTEWDPGNEFFPPTSFQISNIHAGTGAVNVIPGELEVEFNLRFSTESSPDSIRSRVEDCLDAHGLRWELDWNLSGLPFLTPRGALVDACRTAVTEVCGTEPVLSTSGGTSDGRFIAPTGAQVVELGPLNRTIHQIDECIAISDLDLLHRVYYRILHRLLVEDPS